MKPINPSSPSLLDRALTRRFVLKSAGAAASLGAAGLLTSGHRTSAMAIDQDTLVITDSLTTNWKTLDPAWFYEGNPSAAMYLLYDQLYHIPDGENPTDVQPLLATEMPTFSDDGLTATIPLRQDVIFPQTGNGMTAADVIFSFNRLKNTRFAGSFLATEYWSSVTAVDDYTLEFSLPVPYAALPALLSAVMLSVTEKAVVEAAGGTDAEPTSEEEDAPEIQANLAAKEILDQTSAGSGPYRITNWDLNGEVRLVRNENHWSGDSFFETVIWRNTADLNAQLQEVQIGGADLATAVNAEEVSGVEEEGALQVLEGTSMVMQFLSFNLREEWGGVAINKDVRDAMAHAIDYQGIIDGLLLSRALRPATVVPLPLEGTEALLPEAFQTDLAKAQELWNASGVGDATIELAYASDGIGRGGVNLTTLATKLQSDLEKIDGLTLKLVPLPSSQRSAIYRAGEFQATLASWLPDYPGVDSFVTPFFRTGASTAKRVNYSNPEMDEMIAVAAAELDPEEREQMYLAIQRKGLAEAPYIMLYQPNDIKVANRQIEGAQVHAAYSLQLRQARKNS